jgi:hypothetical protein
MPEPRRLDGVPRLGAALGEAALFERFMEAFGGGHRAELADVIGQSLLIDSRLFEDIKGKWKIQKGERAQWLLYTAENIQRPDEIWFEPGRDGGPDRLYYLSRFAVGRRDSLVCIAVFEREPASSGPWSGRTNYATTQTGYVERKRRALLRVGEVRYWRWD